MDFDQVMCSHDTLHMKKGVWYDIVRWEGDNRFCVYNGSFGSDFAYTVDGCSDETGNPEAFYSFRKKPLPVRVVVYARVFRGSAFCTYGPFESVDEVFKSGCVWGDTDKVIFAKVPEGSSFDLVLKTLLEKEKS